MQNKPNFQIAQMNATSVLTMDYRNEPPREHPQNKPNQTQNKANFDLSAPHQSQNKPNFTFVLQVEITIDTYSKAGFARGSAAIAGKNSNDF